MHNMALLGSSTFRHFFNVILSNQYLLIQNQQGCRFGPYISIAYLLLIFNKYSSIVNPKDWLRTKHQPSETLIKWLYLSIKLLLNNIVLLRKKVVLLMFHLKIFLIFGNVTQIWKFNIKFKTCRATCHSKKYLKSSKKYTWDDWFQRRFFHLHSF